MDQDHEINPRRFRGRRHHSKEMKTSLVAPLWNQTGKGVYPICGLVYVIVYQDLNNVKTPEKAKALVEFLSWATHDGQKLAPPLDYAPLNDAVQQKVTEALSKVTYGGKAIAEAK